MNPSLKKYLYNILLLEDVEVKASEARELDSYVLLESGEKTKKKWRIVTRICGMIVVIVISSRIVTRIVAINLLNLLNNIVSSFIEEIMSWVLDPKSYKKRR